MERGAHAGAGLTCDVAEGSCAEQPSPKGLHPTEGTYTGAVHAELQHEGRSHIGSALEVKGSVETIYDELIAIPLPCPHVLHAERRGGKDFGSKVEPRQRGGMEGRCFLRFAFTSYCPT